MKRVVAWVWFAIVQLIQLSAAIVMLFVLIPFCLSQAWELVISTQDPTRVIDRWRWRPLNLICGNPEDGVSGQRALIWINATTRGPYLPGAWAPWRAYRWAALRNSVDNLKYVFRWPEGPLVTFVFAGHTFKLGWQGGLPVLS